MDLEREMILQA